MENSSFVGYNGKLLTLYTWEAKKAVAVLQIVHGMVEHMARYDDFAKFMNKNHITVVGFDLRCHGMTDEKNLGYTEGDIFNDTVMDHKMLNAELKRKYNLPIIVMGHSYGSFVTQRLIESDLNADMFVLSGSNYMKSIKYGLGLFMAKSLERHKGPEAKAEFIANMSFGAYNKKYNGVNNWLSRNEEEVRKYNEDCMCGYTMSAHFYASFFNGIKQLYKKENVSHIDKDIPIYIFSGSGDPVGEYGEGVKKLYDFYNHYGVRNINMRLYEDGRHEMLNETNRDEVYEDILNEIKHTLSLDC